MKIQAVLLIVLLILHFSYGKTFTRCDLAKQLSNTFARDKLADWNCLVKHESNYNSAAKGSRNSDGSYDYGIFQINNKFWCSVGKPGGDCNIDCNKLLDNDITDDIKCAHKIFNRHGFSAWYGWVNNCKGNPLQSVNDCFK